MFVVMVVLAIAIVIVHVVDAIANVALMLIIIAQIVENCQELEILVMNYVLVVPLVCVNRQVLNQIYKQIILFFINILIMNKYYIYIYIYKF